MRWKLHGIRPLLVVAVVAAVLAGAASPPAGALPQRRHQQPGGAGPKPHVPGLLPDGPAPGGFATWAEFYATQERLDKAATAILAAGGAGQASIVVSTVRRELDVYWPGPIPARVRALAPGLGVRVRFAAAAFPLTVLVRRARLLAGDPRVASVAPKEDGSGLAVTIPATFTGTARAAAQRALLAASPIPLTITTGPRPRFMFSRQADTPPFWGGSAYWSVEGCTNGFAVFLPGTNDRYMVSAGHCGNFLDSVVIPGQPDPTGVVWSSLACRDNLLIRYNDGVGGEIYAGPFDSSESRRVSGATPDFVGDWVATGGASSGEHDLIKVTATDMYTSINNGLCPAIGPLTKAVAGHPGWCAVAPGDSGGPVYSIADDGSAIARGTITAGDNNNVGCPGLDHWGSNDVYYAPLLRPDGDPEVGYLQIYGFAVLTG